MKKGKATGSEEIPIEVLEVFDERNVEVVKGVCNAIYIGGYIPVGVNQSIFVPLPKKPKAQKCTEYRTTNPMTHISKFLLKIIQ